MKTSVLCINAALTISCYLILTFSAVHLTQSSQGKSFLFFLSDFVFRGVFRSSSVLCVNFQCCDVRCELGITNDLGEQANFRRGRGLSACVFLATVDIVQLTRLGLLFCFYNRAWWCCHPSVGQVPPPPPRVDLQTRTGHPHVCVHTPCTAEPGGPSAQHRQGDLGPAASFSLHRARDGLLEPHAASSTGA